MTGALIQLCLAVFGLSALAMALSTHPRARKWAPIVGLMAQPFWFWFGLRTGAWGLIAITTAYTVVFAIGARTQWKGAAA